MILALSAFTHLWNPVGFPEIFYDEGIYMHRTMNVIMGAGPQDGKFYDHPFFGQVFLGSILFSIGYPDSLNPSQDSISLLYVAPRVLMGLLAVFDTFLIYKIAQKRYNSKVSVFASLLFAVMPMTWITRRILLDSILLPFVLLSILLALYSKDSKHKSLLIVFSGFSLGLAIFTKIPAFTIIPAVMYLVYSQHKSKRLLALLLIPAILIPLMWPAYSIAHDQFEYWKKGVLWQAQRENTGIHKTAMSFGAIDPVLFGFGIAGLAYAAIKRNWLILWWAIPFVVFLGLIGYTQYFHWMLILPVFCIAASLLVCDIGKNLKQQSTKRLAPTITIILVASFGLASTVSLIGLDVTSNQFKSAMFASELATQKDTVILAGPHFSWIYDDVVGTKNFRDYSLVLFGTPPDKFVFIADPHFFLDEYRGQELSQIYNSTIQVGSFPSTKSEYNVYQYPYSSLGYNYDAGKIEVRVTKNLLD